MKKFTVKRILGVLVGIVLPVAIVIGILQFATQHSYLSAADAFGEEFAQSMVKQAQATVQLTTKENWNSVSVAKAGLPADFAELENVDKLALLQAYAESDEGRDSTYFFYGQNGTCVSSDGTITEMHYTSRTDISMVLAGTSPRTMYGPLYMDDGESDDTTTTGSTEERGGYVVYYTLPVRNGAGNIIGAISLRRDAYEYCDAISALSLGQGGYTYLVDSTDRVIAVSRREKLNLVTEETDKAGQTGKLAALEAETLQGASGAVRLDKADGEEATVVYQPLYNEEDAAAAGFQWGIVAYLPQSDLEGFMRSTAGRDLTGSLGTGLAVALLIGLAVFYVVLDAVRSSRDESERTAREYKDILEQTLRALAGALDSRNVDGKGHGYRVAAYAREIGRHLELSEGDQQKLYFEAALHDIGKLAVPETILQHEREKTLSPEEVLVLRRHVTVGGRILGKLTALPGINEGAMYHHQNYDGNGYCSTDASPVKGEAIPLEARIITVADSFDDLDNNGADLDAAAALDAGKGKKFDPVIADIMIQLCRDGTIARVKIETNEAMQNHAAELAEL